MPYRKRRFDADPRPVNVLPGQRNLTDSRTMPDRGAGRQIRRNSRLDRCTGEARGREPTPTRCPGRFPRKPRQACSSQLQERARPCFGRPDSIELLLPPVALLECCRCCCSAAASAGCSLTRPPARPPARPRARCCCRPTTTNNPGTRPSAHRLARLPPGGPAHEPRASFPIAKQPSP